MVESASFEAVGVEVDERDGVAGLGEDVGDAVAHRAGSDDGDVHGVEGWRGMRGMEGCAEPVEASRSDGRSD